MKKFVNGKGVRVSKGESALDAMKKRVPHWIHDRREDASYMSGFVYLPSCTCSECGYHSNKEKDVCPGCGNHMHAIF